jgi:uncharacterized protein YutE (UPF0331/DUF86 family)
MNYIIYEEIKFVNENLKLGKSFLKDYELSKSTKDLFALERVSEQIVETTIKINKRILKRKNIIPSTYKESFLKLRELKFIDDNFLEKLAETAIFRNELAHDYRNMDKFYSLENIKNILELYPIYLEKLIKFLKKDKK